MGIFSFGKKDEAPSRRGANAGSGRTGTGRKSGQGASQGGRVERRSRRSDRSGDAEATLLDPTLPEKHRARRRLVGAIALVIAAIVVLPMILDSHPKPVTDDIAIDIPSHPVTPPAARDDTQDSQAGVAPDNPAGAGAEQGASTPGVATPEVAKQAASGPVAEAPAQEAPAAMNSQTAQHAQPASAAPAQRQAQARAGKAQPASAPATKATTTTTTTVVRNALPADSDTAVSGTDADSTDAGTPAAPPGARYAVQLGSFADDASARNWVSKLKAAGVPAYTEHRKQPNGKTRTLLRAGPFPDRAAASAAIAKVREAGLTSGVNGGGVE